MGPLLARSLGWTFVDADVELEARAGCTIAEIFRTEGEPGFRDREQALLAELAERPDHVIATGGGVILREANRDVLKRHGFVVWLEAPAEVLWQRLQGDPSTQDRRPNLAGGGFQEIVELLRARESYYKEVAHLRVDAGGTSPETLASTILAQWNTRYPPP